MPVYISTTQDLKAYKHLGIYNLTPKSIRPKRITICSECPFTAKFESALLMHRQLHHDTDVEEAGLNTPSNHSERSNVTPRASKPGFSVAKERKGFSLATTTSATRLFDKLRARICKSKTLVSHQEERVTSNNDLPEPSECTSKAFNADCLLRCSAQTNLLQEASKEIYGCHLCTFDADRITVLDRHLLNDHKIGLENLLKLVMNKTKDGLSEDSKLDTILFGVRQPYYKPQDEIIEDGEFVIETITPKIKILKHSSTNTDIKLTDLGDLKDNCRISRELEKIINPMECDKEDLLDKMQTLSRCMCKFVDSSNALKKVLTKEFDSKSAREVTQGDEPIFDLGLGDSESPRGWERAQSEKMERNRKYGECRGEKSKLASDSFFF